jgi:molybdopterin converting factor subunit 1
MEVTVRLFARARDLAGADSLQLTLPAGTTVGELRRRLAAERPALAALLERCALAVEDEFVAGTVILRDKNEVAVLPPVSGGSETGRRKWCS